MKLDGLISLLQKRFKYRNIPISIILILCCIYCFNIKRLSDKILISDRVFLLWRSVWPYNCWTKSVYYFSSFCALCKSVEFWKCSFIFWIPISFCFVQFLLPFIDSSIKLHVMLIWHALFRRLQYLYGILLGFFSSFLLSINYFL